MQSWKPRLGDLGIFCGLVAAMVCAFALGAGAMGIVAGGSGEASVAWQALPYLHP